MKEYLNNTPTMLEIICLIVGFFIGAVIFHGIILIKEIRDFNNQEKRNAGKK